METVQVRFRFICKPASVKFYRFYSIPSRLVDIADKDAEARQLWSKTARHILEESKTDCLEHSPRICACGSPTTTTGQLPLLLLHGPERGGVVLVDPLCGHGRCQTRVRQESLELISELRRYSSGQPLDTDLRVFTPVLRCEVCATVEGLKRCGQCRAVAYCGKAHQIQDWAAHKAGCVPPHKDEGRVAPATSGPSSRETYGFGETHGSEEPSDDNTVYGCSYSGVFETDDGIQYEVSDEGVLAYLLSGNSDE